MEKIVYTEKKMDNVKVQVQKLIAGRKVQIKISQQDNIVINHEPEYLIVMYLNKSGNIYEVHNGQGKEPWNHADKTDSRNNRHIMVNK